MLRYKVYAVVTHPKFPHYAYYISFLTFIAGIYAICHPELISMKAFISENALSPDYQTSQVSNYISSTSLKEFTQFNNSNLYFTYLKASRTPGTDCICLLFAYNQSKLGIQLAVSLKRYLESQVWGGDLLIVLYKPSPFALEFRKWLEWVPGKFGLIRGFYDFDIEENSSYFSVSGDGLNGIQTDLDQLQAVLQLLSKTNLVVRFPIPLKFMIKNVALSVSSWTRILEGNIHSPHAYILNKGYLAVKVFTVSSGKEMLTNTYSVMKLLELVVRTMTSLDENLHAGYYFYYFSSFADFVPLSKYSYVVAVLVLPLFFQAILVLKEKWWDANGVFLILLPYFSCYAVYFTALGHCDSEFNWYSLLFLALNLLGQGSTQIFKMYSNFALGLSLVIMSIHNFPIALILSALIPIKICLPSLKLPILFYTLFALIALCISYFPIKHLTNIENCSGHHVLFYSLCVVFPCIWHLVYLFN